MKALIAQSREGFINALRKRGIATTVLRDELITIPCPYDGTLWYGDRKINISDYDFAIIVSLNKPAKHLYTVIHNHIPTFGDPYVRNLFDNKVTGQAIVSEHGIPVIPLLYNMTDPLVQMETLHDKVVVKMDNLANGINVKLFDLPLQYPQEKRITQQYIECGHTDQRWIVVGDRIVCAMQRTASRDGEFRANLGQGGTGAPIEITEDMQELARRIVEPFPNFLYAGIDIITDPATNTRYFLEANLIPGSRIIEITHHNYYDDIVDYIINQVNNKS